MNRRQRGFALVAAMMVLALLSILGAAAIQSTTLEVKISARDQDARVALYLAESALEEARYYAARRWGKVSPHAAGQVQVATPSPPGLSWAGDRYTGFFLVDERGDRYRITSHTDMANPIITVSGGTPTPGPFTISRDGLAGAWDGTRLVFGDDEWALHSGPDTWRGWIVWNGSGQPFVVESSDTDLTTSPMQVRLTIPNPGAGPYSLSFHPWLAALAAGATSLPGDFDDPASPDRWDRVFYWAPNQELGRGRVTAEWIPPDPANPGPYQGTFKVAAGGEAGPSRREASFRVYGAGLPEQRIRDWHVR
jgi:type II secretory pathway pseudopilin PulG